MSGRSGDFTLFIGGKKVATGTSVATAGPAPENKIDAIGPIDVRLSLDVGAFRYRPTDPVERELLQLAIQDRVALEPYMAPNERREAEGHAAWETFLGALVRSLRR